MTFDPSEWANARAHILGDCPVCGGPLNVFPATITNTTTGALEHYGILACETDPGHTPPPSDPPGYTPDTTDKGNQART